MSNKKNNAENGNFFIIPGWAGRFKNIICGFTLPVLGNQALTRESISSGKSTFENRKNLAKILNIDPGRIFYPHQIHSNTVIDVTLNEAGKGASSLADAIKGDACFTKIKNILLATTWADCIPVILYNSKKEIIASVHSGWRGTRQNIVKKVIDKIIPDKSDNKNLFAAIGPGIRDCCYKVGDEFNDYFNGTELQNFLIKRNNYFYFDLAGSVYQQIMNEGILKENIDFIDKCTCCSIAPSFFSCRKEGALFESQAAFIAMI